MGADLLSDPDALVRQLLTSAAWVIGIPTAITLIIVLAIWFTENVWVPTESALVQFIL